MSKIAFSKQQVGGDHYLKATIEPREVMEAIDILSRHQRYSTLGFYLGSVIKRVIRNKGDKKTDIEKACHELGLLVEAANKIKEEGEQNEENN